MKIAIIGYSGSGKSTLAQFLGTSYGIPVLHLDKLHFGANWFERPDADFKRELEAFLKQEKAWVIDGNYSRNLYKERLEAADCIIFFSFSKWACLHRAFKRYRTHRGTSRSSMADDCLEKFDWAFIRWILWDGRRKSYRQRYQAVCQHYKDKVIILRNQRDLDDFLRLEKKNGEHYV